MTNSPITGSGNNKRRTVGNVQNKKEIKSRKDCEIERYHQANVLTAAEKIKEKCLILKTKSLLIDTFKYFFIVKIKLNHFLEILLKACFTFYYDVFSLRLFLLNDFLLAIHFVIISQLLFLSEISFEHIMNLLRLGFLSFKRQSLQFLSFTAFQFLSLRTGLNKDFYSQRKANKKLH